MDAEQSILAGILINNDAMNQVMDILSPDDFYREAHAHLFEGMVDLYNNNEPIDLVTLSQLLTGKDLLEKAGGTEFLASLVDAVSTSAGIQYHAEIVRDLSVRRKLINQCSIISERCFQGWQETDELLDQAEQSIFDIAEQKIGEGFSTLEEVIKGSFKKLESVAEHEGFVTGVPTDFRDLDRLTAGLQPSDLIQHGQNGPRPEHRIQCSGKDKESSCGFLPGDVPTPSGHEASRLSLPDKCLEIEDRLFERHGLDEVDRVG
jgi:replicative DNA helicase